MAEPFAAPAASAAGASLPLAFWMGLDMPASPSSTIWSSANHGPHILSCPDPGIYARCAAGSPVERRHRSPSPSVTYNMSSPSAFCGLRHAQIHGSATQKRADARMHLGCSGSRRRTVRGPRGAGASLPPLLRLAVLAPLPGSASCPRRRPCRPLTSAPHSNGDGTIGQHVDEAGLEGHHPVPLGLVHPVPGVAIDIPLVGRDAHVGHAAPRDEMVHGDVGAEAADDFRAVESEAHGLLLQVWLMTMECERPGPGRLSPPPSPFTLPALHSNSGLTPDPVSEEMERCGLTSAAPYGANGDGTITRSPGTTSQTQQGAS